MKLYQPKEQPPTVNINIKQAGAKTEHITGVLGDLSSVFLESVDIVSKSGKFSPIATGKHVVVEFREYIKGENGKTKSFKMYSTTPKEIKAVLMAAID